VVAVGGRVHRCHPPGLRPAGVGRRGLAAVAAGQAQGSPGSGNELRVGVVSILSAAAQKAAWRIPRLQLCPDHHEAHETCLAANQSLVALWPAPSWAPRLRQRSRPSRRHHSRRRHSNRHHRRGHSSRSHSSRGNRSQSPRKPQAQQPLPRQVSLQQAS
jgi:hypothetical protein